MFAFMSNKQKSRHEMSAVMKAVNNLQLFLKGLIFKVQNMSDYAVALKTKNLLNYDQTGMYKNQIWQNYKK